MIEPLTWPAWIFWPLVGLFCVSIGGLMWLLIALVELVQGRASRERW
jgi:hypothetical protein